MGPEILCVSYIAAIFTIVAALHWRNESAGKMEWDTLKWDMVAKDHRGRSKLLAVLRLTMGLYALGTTASVASEPVKYTESGELALAGPVILCTFTFWSWTLIGVYLCAVGTISAFDTIGVTCKSRALCMLWVLFEIVFSMAILVFLIVWLVLIPEEVLKTGSSGDFLSDYIVVSAHNLNVVFMCIECMLNRMSFVPAHFVFLLYYGITYILFSIVWFLYAGTFYYFFIDWRQPTTVIAYTGLIGIIFASFTAGRKLSAYIKSKLASDNGDTALPSSSLRLADVAT
jgi:hypothetical protein